MSFKAEVSEVTVLFHTDSFFSFSQFRVVDPEERGWYTQKKK